MKPENAIEVKDVTKNFKIFVDRGGSLKEQILFSKRRKFEYRKVLQGISFEVKKGEAIGLVGHNGCGKSTTLKLLTRILYPDTGTIEMCGRVSSLIELGAGFHPDLSGRENIYINASIFGLSKKEIDARLDDIIAFSELKDFIDNPVRTYSSGMYMRLAFSVAINVDADVLLIDEILAVGDANFQIKCFKRLKEIKNQGTTIVIVSHALNQIEQICDRSIWIQDGRIQEEGSPLEVHKDYLDYMGRKRQGLAELEHVAPGDGDLTEIPGERGKSKRWGDQRVSFTRLEILNNEGMKCNLFETGADITLRMHYQVKEKLENAVFGFGIFRQDGVWCYGTNTTLDGEDRFTLEKDGSFSITLRNVSLLPNEYRLDISIEEEGGIPVDYYTGAAPLEFFSSMPDVGVARIDHTWHIEN